MTIAQTSYSKFFNTQVAGGLFDNSMVIDVITATDIYSADTAGVPFGVVVVNDGVTAAPHLFTSEPNTNKLAKLPSASTDITNLQNILGVALFTELLENDAAFNLSATNVYPQNYPMNILKSGRVVVKPEQTVVAGDPVFVRYAAGSFTQLGALRKDADTSSAAQVTAWSWYRGSDANGLAVLKV